MAVINVNKLREYLLDYCGSAMASGFLTAMLDLTDVEHASGEELCRIAEQMGIDLRGFVCESSD
ncbi:MAG: hypothetical protein SPE77_07840 [Collinsella sp.]|nr:hypothetical protein [Collinsella sp.]